MHQKFVNGKIVVVDKDESPIGDFVPTPLPRTSMPQTTFITIEERKALKRKWTSIEHGTKWLLEFVDEHGSVRERKIVNQNKKTIGRRPS